MNAHRADHTATLLADGRVLVAGGYSPPADLATAEIYDPATGVWTPTGNLTMAREGAQAALLPNGQVLVAGGDFGTASAELYDPATGMWTATDSLNVGRWSFTMALLATGKVLAAAGLNGTATALASAELYDPGTTTEATTVNGTGFVPGQGGVARFTLRASLSGDRASGTLTYHDVGANIAFQKAKVRTLTFNGNSAALTGNARLGDGTKVTYSVTVTDGSSNGTSDTFNITLSNGYSAGGAVTNGDISIQ